MASKGFRQESKGINKIPKKFYPLQHEEVLETKKLTKSQLLVLYYLRTLDPYSNGIKIKASKIAQELELSKRTVYAAMQYLVEEKIICLEEIEYTVKVQPKGCLCDCDTSNADAENINTTSIENCTSSASSPPKQDYTSEMPSGNGFQKPKNDAKEFKKDNGFEKFKESLSEEERESFIKFGLDKASQLPKPPSLKNKWVEKNWEEIREEWLSSRNKPSSSQTNKWANHPQREEWLLQIRKEGWGAFIADAQGNIDDEKNAFLNWASKEKLV